MPCICIASSHYAIIHLNSLCNAMCIYLQQSLCKTKHLIGSHSSSGICKNQRNSIFSEEGFSKNSECVRYSLTVREIPFFKSIIILIVLVVYTYYKYRKPWVCITQSCFPVEACMCFIKNRCCHVILLGWVCVGVCVLSRHVDGSSVQDGGQARANSC